MIKALVILGSLVGMLIPGILFATEISQITSSGDKLAEIRLDADGELSEPQLKVRENVAELIFSQAQIAAKQKGKIELFTPHSLIQRITATNWEKGQVKVEVVVNGSAENLKNRLSFKSSPQGMKVELGFAKGETPSLSLLKQEDLPLDTLKPEKASVGERSMLGHIFLSCLVFLLAGVGTFFVVRFLRKNAAPKGTRKYLIEQIAYQPVGTKTGVGLFKVGTEFFFVGVTPNQINLISRLPKLENQYEEESKFERGVFKEAVEEEFRRLKGNQINA